MNVEIRGPDWIRDGRLTLGLTELNPHAAEALIETLRDAMEAETTGCAFCSGSGRR